MLRALNIISALVVSWLFTATGGAAEGSDLGASQAAITGPPLTNLSQLTVYVGSQTVTFPAVDLEGIVTWVAAGADSFVMQDGDRAVLFRLQRSDRSLVCGARVRLEGMVALGKGSAELRQFLHIEDDGQHGMRERSARQWFKAGLHAFRLEYFQGAREQGLEVHYQGPNIPRQRIPSAGFFHSEAGVKPVPGLRVELYEGSWTRLPDFERLTPGLSLIVPNLELIQPNPGTNFALRFSGQLNIPVDGEYRFSLASDDGSRLSFDERPWRVTQVGLGEPPATRRIYPGQRLDDEENQLWSEVQGQVRFVGTSEGKCSFDLVSDVGQMRVEVSAAASPLAELLAASHVRIQGVCLGQRKPSGPLFATDLLVPSMDNICIEYLPGHTWRRFASNSIASLHQLEPGFGIVRLGGVVREAVAGRNVTVVDGSGEIQVEAPQARNDWKGNRIDVLGAIRVQGGKLSVLAGAVQFSDSNGIPRTGISPIQSIRTAPAAELERGARVRIRGVVICDLGSFALTVHDGNYGISCWFDDPCPPLNMGDFVEVEGNVRTGAFGPNLGGASVRVLGRARLPAPLTPPWVRLINGSLEQQWVEIEGVVQRIRERTLTVEMVGGRIEAEILRGDVAEIAKFQDAVVRVRGSVTPIYNAQRQIQGAKLRVSSPLYIEVETPAHSDPFAMPEKSFEELSRFDPGSANPFYRVKVRGIVIYAGGGECHLMEGRRGLRFTPKAGIMLRPGDLVEVVGFPELGGSVPLLREALVSTNGSGELPPPRRVTPEEFFGGKQVSTRVQLDALMVSSSQGQQERTLELQFGGRLVTARLRGGQSLVLDAPIGSRLQLIGTCVGRGLREDLGGADLYDLLVNYATDVTVLQMPPWWTVRRIMVVVAMLAVVLMAASAWIYLLHRKVEQRTAELDREMRQRKEAELQRASEQERSRIARDLHDDLGSSLTEISLLAGLGLARVDGESANERFSEIAGKSRALVTSLDAIVWAADPEDDTMEAFADYLTGHARVFLESSGILCRFRVPIEFPPVKLSGRIRHALFLAVKETLNNVVRHAQASEVEFGIQLADLHLALLISDDGRGFDQANVQYGNGLTNLQERLTGIGGDCSIESSPGKGTKVKLTLKLKVTT